MAISIKQHLLDIFLPVRRGQLWKAKKYPRSVRVEWAGKKVVRYSYQSETHNERVVRLTSKQGFRNEFRRSK